MIFNQKACSALSSCSMRRTSIYRKNLFFPRDSEGKGPPSLEYLLSINSSSQPGWAKGCLLSAVSTCTPAHFWANQCLCQPAHWASREGQQLLPKHFPSPVPPASAQYVQPWPAMAGFLKRLRPTASGFLHVTRALEGSARIQPNCIWFLESSMLKLLTTLKGPDLIHNMLISPTERTIVHEHKLTKELQPCIYLLYLIPRKNFPFVYLRIISSLYSSLWKIDLVPFCCMQKA